MPDVQLVVNGRSYAGWTEVSASIGIGQIAGSFRLSSSDRWDANTAPWPIVEEDECVLQVEGVSSPLITGHVDARTLSLDAESHGIAVSGRDRTAALVDCSAVLPAAEFSKMPIGDLCATLAEPFGISVSIQGGIDDSAINFKSGRGGGAPSSVGAAGPASSMRLASPIAKLTINPGDSPFEIIDRACRMVGALAVSDGRGGLVITRAGGSRATTAIVEGQNLLNGSVSIDASRRYRRYIVSGQSAGSDDLFGTAAAAVKKEAQDLRVRRANRVLLVRPEGVVTLAFAQQRAAWEATVRAARSVDARLSVAGWQQRDGTLWPLNGIVSVKSPTLALDGDMLIAEATFEQSITGGSVTTLGLVPPDAYIPEPLIERGSKSAGVPSFLGGP